MIFLYTLPLVSLLFELCVIRVDIFIVLADAVFENEHPITFLCDLLIVILALFDPELSQIGIDFLAIFASL